MIILISVCALCACTDKFGELQIIAEDQADVEAGEYTLEYSVENYEKYHIEYNLKLSVHVYDEDNNSVDVSDNRTITVEKDKIYTVIVLLTGVNNDKTESVSKEFSVAAEKSPLLVSFILTEDDGTYEYYREYYVKYGKTLPYSEVPEVPDYYPDEETGKTRVISSKIWVVYDKNNNKTELTEAMLAEITTPLQIYAVYTYQVTALSFTVAFDTDGGTEITPFTAACGTQVQRPADPLKDGCAFCGWYYDSTFSTLINWKSYPEISGDTTYYAKWLKTENATEDKYFDFILKTDDNGYKYYSVKADDDNIITGELNLPNTHSDGNNVYPVRDLESDAFSGCGITSLRIPNSYDKNTNRAFSDCENLADVSFEDGSALTQIDNYAFCGCASLISINLPDTVTRIMDRAFEGCVSLPSITIPANVYTISHYAFYRCGSLTEVAIPDSVYYIGTYAFAECAKLTEFTMSKDCILATIFANSLENTAVTELKLPYCFSDSNPFAGTENITVTFYEKEEAE